VAVSLFAPGAAAAAGATIELLDIATSHVVSSARLARGSQVESLAFGTNALFVSLGDAMSSEVVRLAVPALAAPGAGGPGPSDFPQTLETLSLDDTGGAVWATDQSMLACLDSSSGRVLASTTSPSSVAVGGVVVAGPTTYVVTSSGIGVLASPSAC
jgi:outer membrane protein assembly factor BamB